MEESLTRRVERLRQHIQELAARDAFNGTIRVSCEGEVMWEDAYGLAHRELNVPNTLSTVYRIGSVTKSFTATAILQLVEQGKLRLDDTIDRYFPGFPRGDQVTIHHLLTHSSGIYNYSLDPDFTIRMATPATFDSLLKLFRDKPADFAPGEQFKYGNSGYILLGELIEQCSGLRFETYMQQHILDPLGLTQTGCTDHRRIVQGQAAGYERDDAGTLTNCAYVDYSNAGAAGYLYSTVGDLHLFEQSFYTETLLSRDLVEKMFTPHIDEYGYGWRVRHKNRPLPLIWHGGVVNGFTSFVERDPNERVSLIWLTNVLDTHVEELRKSCTEILFPE